MLIMPPQFPPLLVFGLTAQRKGEKTSPNRLADFPARSDFSKFPGKLGPLTFSPVNASRPSFPRPTSPPHPPENRIESRPESRTGKNNPPHDRTNFINSPPRVSIYAPFISRTRIYFSQRASSSVFNYFKSTPSRTTERNLPSLVRQNLFIYFLSPALRPSYFSPLDETFLHLLAFFLLCFHFAVLYKILNAIHTCATDTTARTSHGRTIMQKSSIFPQIEGLVNHTCTQSQTYD